jgi:hypothetical protein
MEDALDNYVIRGKKPNICGPELCMVFICRKHLEGLVIRKFHNSCGYYMFK